MTAAILLLSFALAGASEDPRVGCRDMLLAAPLREALVADARFSECELERMAIVPGEVRATISERLGRACVLRPLPHDVAVMVPPRGEPFVYHVPSRGKIEPFRPKAPEGFRIVVPSFRTSLRWAADGWRWKKTPPRTLLTGEITQAQFLKRYPESIRTLVGRGELTPDLVRRGIVVNATFNDEPKVVLLADDSTVTRAWPPSAPRLFVFERDRDALEPFHAKVWTPIRLASGFRFEKPGAKWIEGTGAAMLEYVLERAGKKSFREFARSHPSALDGLVAGLKIQEALAEPVEREGTSQTYWMIEAYFSEWDVDQFEPQRLLYAPAMEKWSKLEGPTAPTDAIFRLRTGARWGLNLGETPGWKALPSVEELAHLMNDMTELTEKK